MTPGERICILRKQHNMTMEELGSCIGVQKSAINKYEKGIVPNIPRKTIIAMATLFGVTPSYLMCFDQWDENNREFIELYESYCKLNEKKRDIVRKLIEELLV